MFSKRSLSERFYGVFSPLPASHSERLEQAVEKHPAIAVSIAPVDCSCEGSASILAPNADSGRTFPQVGDGDHQPPIPPSRIRLYAAKLRSEEHTSELQSLMRTSNAVF